MIAENIMLGTVYIVLAMMLVLGALISRREKPAKLLVMALAWVAIFGAGFVLFTFRDDFGWVMQRLRAEAVGEPVVQAEEIRIPMAIDGHFWVEGRLNGERVRFLVDSGATMTTIGRDTADQVGLREQPGRGQLVRTGAGIIRVGVGRADTLSISGIERDGLTVHIAEQENLNVLGMNFLSSLQRWGVEGRWLVLIP